MATGRLEQYVLMPARGTRATDPNSTVARAFLQAHAGAGAMRMASPRGQATETLRVIDSIHEDGIKLIEGTPEAVLALRAEQPGLRVGPRPASDRRGQAKSGGGGYEARRSRRVQDRRQPGGGRAGGGVHRFCGAAPGAGHEEPEWRGPPRPPRVPARRCAGLTSSP